MASVVCILMGVRPFSLASSASSAAEDDGFLRFLTLPGPAVGAAGLAGLLSPLAGGGEVEGGAAEVSPPTLPVLAASDQFSFVEIVSLYSNLKWRNNKGLNGCLKHSQDEFSFPY